MKVNSVSAFHQKWLRRNQVLSLSMVLLLALTVLVLVLFFDMSMVCFGILLPIYFCTYLLFRSAKPTMQSSYTYLHNLHPEFEFSLRQMEAGDEEQVLAQLQREKIQKVFENTDLQLPRASRIVRGNMVLGLLALIILLVLPLFNQKSEPKIEDSNLEKSESILPVNKVLDTAYVDNMAVQITPPVYTGLRKRVTTELDLAVAEGSNLTWTFDEHGPVTGVEFYIGEDQERVDATKGKSVYKALNSFLYYYAVNDIDKAKITSPYYSVKVKEDEQPQASLSGIDEYQKLPWKDNYDISFKINLSDDYGIDDAFISATVASGSGESVLFREKKFELNNFKKGRKNYSGAFEFSTSDFAMEPGSELYFYVMAKDNCPFRIQAAKTTTFFVVLEDTVSYDYVDDSGMQVDLMPDFFRSQRQIIIDTEKLLEEKGLISQEEFKKRSNELGFDQKMLRLKYGQFLGEEAESGIALENDIEGKEDDHEHDHDHDHEHEEAEDGMEDILNEYGHNHDHEAEAGDLLATSGTEKEDPRNPSWVEELSHSHDNADENTYFEISLKTKLKAALSVMWDSELHLRLYDPEKSLPYQYQALEFLEEIKNHARVYVHRIGFDPPAIKVAEKRLSGEQDKIITPNFEIDRKEDLDRLQTEAAISYFSSLKRDERILLDDKEKGLLEAAGIELAQIAIEQPSLLEALTDLRIIINADDPISSNKLLSLRQAMIKSLPRKSEEIRSETQVFHPLNGRAIQALRESK